MTTAAVDSTTKPPARRLELPEVARGGWTLVLELEDDPLTLNYVRLNIEATRAG